MRIPPQALDVEKTVLASALINEQACQILVENVTDPKTFYRTANQIIFQAIVKIFNNGTPVDILTISESLKSTKQLEQVGSESYLSELVDDIDTVKNVLSHIKILKSKFKLRKWIDIGTKIINTAYDGVDDYEEFETDIERQMLLLEDRAKSKTALIGEGLGEFFGDVQKASEGKSVGITTGFKGIDEKTGGFYPGDLIILAARPSMGKSALMNNMATNCWNLTKRPVLIFSLEMTRAALLRRFMSSVSEVDGTRIRGGRLIKKELDKLNIAAGEIDQMKIHVNEDPYLNVYNIRSAALRLHRKHNFGMIMVDYLQKIRDVGKFENKRIETAEKSAVLKSIAKELSIPVIALAQLSRACESRPHPFKRPVLSDLREAGDIEQDADVVSFVYRPFMTGESDNISEAELIIAKQREGPTGTVGLTFEGNITTFKDLKDGEEPNGGYEF